MSSKKLKLPYGMTENEEIINQGYYYVDRTKYIGLLEDSEKFIVFIRLRRFGKSLFISTLEHYYDINSRTYLNYFKDMCRHNKITYNENSFTDGIFEMFFNCSRATLSVLSSILSKSGFSVHNKVHITENNRVILHLAEYITFLFFILTLKY